MQPTLTQYFAIYTTAQIYKSVVGKGKSLEETATRPISAISPLLSHPPPPIGRDGLVSLIGNTPLILIKSLSKETGCTILAKAEFLNPGGSVKDRVALSILQEAFSEQRLFKGGLVTEGTVGSTGVSLALISHAFGIRCFIAMPDDAAIEKSQILEALGAEVQRLRPVSIAHPSHFVNVARRRAANEENAIFADQFENPANFRAHIITGEEIWAQTEGRLDAFVSGAGTGGTIAGVGCALKGHNPAMKIYLADPPGSGLYNKVTRGVLYSPEEAEGKRLKHPFDTITEGVGINRVTANFQKAKVDGALKVNDREAVVRLLIYYKFLYSCCSPNSYPIYVL